MMMRPYLSFSAALLFAVAAPQVFAITDYYSSGPGQGSADTLDDVWQDINNAWGLSPTADTDNDGCTNYVESLAGTDPRNPNDCLAVGNFAISANNVVVTFRAEKGKKYQVWQSDSPAGAPPSGGWTLVAGANKVSTVDHANDTIVFSKPALTRKFYRLESLDADTDGDGVSDWAENKLGTSPSVANNTGAGYTYADTLRSMMSLQVSVVSTEANGFEVADKSAAVPAPAPAKVTLIRTWPPVGDPVPAMPLTGITLTGAGGAPDATKSNASAGDYTLPGAISIPAGQGTTASPFKANVTPVKDTVDEVPEFATISVHLPLPTSPTLAQTPTICICDADPLIANNSQLYIAYLGREAGVTSTASGYATALVNGDNTSASISIVFNNLSSEQNTAYIRDASNHDLAPALPNGQVSGVSYGIVYKSGFFSSDQAFLSALASGNIWCAISSAAYSDKEISGPFQKANGSTTFDPNRPDLVAPTGDWQNPTGAALEREIWRFLSQSTWGGTQALYDAVLAKVNAVPDGPTKYITGLSNWLDEQMNPTLTPSVNFRTLVMAADNEEFLLRGNKPSTYNGDPQINNSTYTVTYDNAGNPIIGTTANNNNFGGNYPQGSPNRRREWWTMILQCKDQFRQRMAQALSEITIISEADQNTLDRHYGCANYWDMLAANAFGKYRTLLENVSYSPMMGFYLTSMGNRVAYDAGGGIIVSPDENYAREIMQLFSIGLILRHPDGSLVLSTDGLPISTYDNNDITEMARVMTGWSHGARHAIGYQSSFSGTTLTYNNASAQRISDLVLFNAATAATNNNNVWFSSDSGHLYWAAPWINPMKLIGRISSSGTAGTVYHDFNQYYTPPPALVPVANVSKRLLAGKHGQFDVPIRTGLPGFGIGANDMAWHAAAVLDMTDAHNCLAGNPASSIYGDGSQGNPGHQNTPINISRWLIQRLVTSNPSAGYIYRVQKAYRDTNGNLGAVFKAILLDYEARSLELADTSISHGKVKEPLVAFAAMLRSLRAFSGSPVSILKDNPPPFSGTDSPLPGPYPQSEFDKFDTSNFNPPSLPTGWSTGPFRFRHNDLTGNIGQSPQRPPSVFNWFLPDFVVPGPMAQAGLFAPELQISTESNAVAKANFFYSYTWSNLTGMSTQPGVDTSDFLLNNAFATPAVRFSLDGGVTFVNSLTFTAANFATPQTITVVAANTPSFSSLDNSLLRFTLSGAGSGYDALPADPINIGFTDNEIPNEAILALHTGFSTWVQEGGKTDTVTVRLAAPPPTGVTVTVNVTTTSSQVTVAPTSFTFDSSNWNANQTATVTAVADTTAELPGAGGDTLTFTAAAGSGIYSGLAATVPVGVTDNSAASGTNAYDVLITESAGSTDVTESTLTVVNANIVDSYTIVLTRQPSAGVNVVVTCTPNRAEVGLNTTNGGTTFSTAAVTRTFTSLTWNVAQTVLVRGNDDTSRESSYPANPMHNVTITHSVGATGGYAATSALQPVIAAIADNDNRIILTHVGNGETRVKEGGSVTDSITVALRTAPTADVTVNLGSNSVVCSPTNLVFTSLNYNVLQTVTVTAVDDFVNEGSQPVLFSPGNAPTIATATSTISSGAVTGFTITNPGAGYAGNPTVSFTAAPTGGTTATGSVVIGSNGTVTGINIIIPGSGYLVAPTVTIGAPQNAPALITASATSKDISDANYNNEWGNTYNGTFTVLNVSVLDNDAAALVVTPTGGSTVVVEGGATDDVSFTLAQQPASDVTVTLTPGTQVFTSATTLTFTPANWSVAQNVTVTAVNDTTIEGEALTSIGVLITSSDKAYSGLKARAIPVTVQDNDQLVPLTVTHTNVFTGVAEGGTAGTGGTPNVSDTFTVLLPRAPIAPVTVTLISDSAQVTVSPSLLSFTTSTTGVGAYTVGQTVTVTAVDDANPEPTPHNTALRFAVASADPFYNNPAHLPVLIPIKDNDSPGFSIVESGGNTTPTEGGTDSHTVVLTKQPTVGQNVVINVASGSSADLLLAAGGTLTGCATINTSLIVTTANTAGLAVGTLVSGNGIPGGASVAAIVSPTSFTLSAAATATSATSLANGATTSGSVTVTCTSTTGVTTGMTLTGPGIPSGTTVTAVTNTTTLQLSNAALATASALTFSVSLNLTTTTTSLATLAGSSTTTGSPVVTTNSTAGLFVGMTITGSGIPAGAIVATLVSPTSFALSVNATVTSATTLTAGATTNGSATVTCDSTTGVSAGMSITGAGIPAGTTVVFVTNATTLLLSAPATADGTGLTFSTSLNLTATTASGPTLALAFTSTNWNIPQTVTVTAIADMLTEGRELVPVTHTISTVSAARDTTYDAVPAQTVNAFITEQHRRNASLVVIPSGGSIRSGDATPTGGNTYVTEGDSATDSVDFYLSHPPAFPVTVTLSANAQMGFNQSVFYFTAANWNVPQTVQVSAIDDDFNDTYAVINGVVTAVTQSQNITFNLTGDPEFFANNPTTAVNILDNDSPAVKITQSGGITTTSEVGGTSDTYNVVLTTAPNGNVVVRCTSASITAGQTVLPAALTFTPANWNVAQTVTVNVVNDTTVEGNHQSNITHAIRTAVALPLSNCSTNATTTVTTSSVVGLFTGMVVVGPGIPLNATISSINTTANTFVISSAATATASGLSLNAYGTTPDSTGAVVLLSNGTTSSGITTITCTSTASLQPGTRLYGTGIAPGTTVASITNATTFEASIAATASGTALTLAAIAATTDTTGYVLPITGVSTSAASTTVTCTSTVGLAIGMQVTGLGITAGATVATVASPTTFTLSAATPAANTGLTLFANIVNIQTVVNHIDDNDNRIIITPSGLDTRVHEDNTLAVGDTYTVVLRSAPSGANTVTVTPAITGGFAAQGLAISPASVVFNSGNFAAPQTFTLSAADNGYNFERARTVTITHTSASGDANFNAQTIHSVGVSMLAKDSARILLIDNPGVTENGATSTYRVALSRAPTANVNFALTTPDNQLQVAPPIGTSPALIYGPAANLTFTPDNWMNFQTVTLRAIDDAIAETPINTGSGYLHTGGVVQVATSTDATYNGAPAGTALTTITDNEVPSVRITPSGGSLLLTEGRSAVVGPPAIPSAADVADTYEIVLTQAPTADVTINISTDSQSTASPTAVTFNAGNWSTAQTVTVSPTSDTVVEGTHSTLITHSAAISTDLAYSGMPVPTLTGSIADTDGAQLLVTQTGGTTAVVEGGANDTFTLSLTQAPLSNVTVSLIPPMYIVPVPPYAKQYGYYTSDLGGSNQQKDRVVVDYTEIILLYRTTFYASLAAAYSPSAVPTVPSDVNLQNAHWAATKAIVDKMDLWWCQGSLKANYPDASHIIQPNQAAPTPPLGVTAGLNPRQVVLDCLYQINGGANSLGTTRYLPEITYDPKNPPVGTFHDEIRDRARWAGYLMSTVMPGFVSH